MSIFTFPIALCQRLSVLVGTGLLLTTLVLSGCKKADDGPAPVVVVPPAVQLTASATLGNFLTDGQGNTLYYFALDVNGSNACSDAACTAEWPVFYAPTVTVGTGLSAADFTTGQTAGGAKQTYYKGWPLYYYAAAASGQNVREKAGETRGNGVGNVWYVVRPDYSIMVAMSAVMNQTTGKPTFKRYLVDPQGRTLYTFGIDTRLPSTQPTNCTGGCVAVWPVFYQATATAPSSLQATDFGTIMRPDGPNGNPRPQTTYKGSPLYYYTADANVRGKAAGDGTADQWAVANP